VDIGQQTSTVGLLKRCLCTAKTGGRSSNTWGREIKRISGRIPRSFSTNLCGTWRETRP